MPMEVDRIFAKQPLDPRGGGSDPPRPPRPPEPLRYFGLPMMNPSRPPLPPNMPYHQPLNYLEYVENTNPNVHVRVFKAIIKANGETYDVEIVNLFNFTLKDIVSDWCNNYMGDYRNYTFAKL
jgi:hypothetical protein